MKIKHSSTVCETTFCTKCAYTVQKIHIEDFLSKREQISWKVPIWSHLLKKSYMENFSFYAVLYIIRGRLNEYQYLLGLISKKQTVSS